MDCHMYFIPQPQSSYSGDPPNRTVLCSSIPNSTLVVTEDQGSDGVCVSQLTYTVIHEEYEWDLEHQSLTMS